MYQNTHKFNVFCKKKIDRFLEWSVIFKHDRKKNSTFVNTSRCPIQSLRKLP